MRQRNTRRFRFSGLIDNNQDFRRYNNYQDYISLEDFFKDSQIQYFYTISKIFFY